MAITKEQIELMKEAQLLARALNIEQEKLVELQENILAGNIKNADQLESQVETLREESKVMQARLKQEQELTDLKKKQDKAEKDSIDLAHDMKSILSRVRDMNEKTYETDKARIVEAKKLGAITEGEAYSMLGILQTQKKMADNPIIKEGFTSAANSLDEMQKSITGFVSKLPGGDFISKALKLDKLSEKLQSSIINGGKAGFIAVGVIAVAALLTVFKALSDEASKFSTETGVAFSQARGIADAARQAQTSFGNQLSTQQDILDVQQETIAALGIVGALSADVAMNVSETGKAYGYGAKQAALVNNEFMLMGASAQDAANAQEELAAKAFKAGVNVGAVMKDISANAKSVAKYFGGNVTALTNAAVEAAKLGMNLAQMGKIADSLLDIETSLSSQFEYQALTGKEINLDSARQLALQGDIAGAAKEVVSQFGSLAELQSQGPLAMEAAAKAAGMTVDELTKSLAVQEKLGDLTEDQQAAMANLGISAAEIQKLSASELKDRLAQQQATDKAAASMEKVKNQLMLALTPLAEMVGTILGVLTPAFDVLGVIIKAALWPITTAVQGVKDMYNFLFMGGEQLSFWGTTLGSLLVIIGAIKAAQFALLGYQAATNALAVIKAAMDKRAEQSLIAQGLQMGRNLLIAIAEAVAKITGMSAVTLGAAAAIALAAGAAAYAFLGSKKTGDLAMSANNGPIVANPREGTIFQGTRNDEVAMGPGVIGAAQRTQPVVMAAQQQQASSAGTAAAMGEQNRILSQIAEGQKTPAPIQIGTNVIREINTSVQVDKSFNKLGSYNR
jgi:hypothetical protein